MESKLVRPSNAIFQHQLHNNDVTVGQVREAVAKEIDGPGKLLGYRAMQKKLQQEHELNVPRDLVYAVMQEVDPECLATRGGVGKVVPTFSSLESRMVSSKEGEHGLKFRR